MKNDMSVASLRTPSQPSLGMRFLATTRCCLRLIRVLGAGLRLGSALPGNRVVPSTRVPRLSLPTAPALSRRDRSCIAPALWPYCTPPLPCRTA